ncbi:hypothetical protein TRIADDRAFT_56107 [Trichoplax adhaerens]|uniref:Uncharacterized protein n=1 Tax=Trichoplax adhaerens TaxID=10228 RepID=B3RX74_TRIAD|nr:hypothetical protein TRIADDRAFT_56107 [Trichoplax adhaerens]EDV24821.1 hypothetical protein TRIADDRAFT_56107 [Trichoplax adhaerens]|eukprot:XP_002112711.1 hypothetical protein TRIADDRAFT_56107 [Trichoplax adhaerens]
MSDTNKEKMNEGSDIGDTVKRIDGTEVPLLTPWLKVVKAPVAEKPRAKPAPKKAKAPEAEPEAGDKPATLDAARGGKADDLKMIKGVGPKLEGVLNSIGIFHYDQIAAWTADEIAWADQNLVGFKGRVSRDDWVAQAKLLATGEETEFAKRAKEDGTYDED